MFKYLCLLTLVFVFHSTIYAQSCHYVIEGYVYEQDGKTPIEQASIYIEEKRLQIQTNENGYYKFSNLCEGFYTVHCFNTGHYEQLKTISLNQEKKNMVSFQLQYDSLSLTEVTIVGQTKDTLISFGGQSTLNGLQLELSKSLSLGESLKSLPGVYAQQSGANVYKPVVQGLSGNRVIIMNNGIRQEGQQWGTDHAPEIDPLVAQEIVVIKGAEAVKYGSDVVGGVILINPAPLIDHGTKIEVISAYHTVNRAGHIGATLDFAPHRVKGFSSRIQGSIKQGGNYKTPRYYLENTGVKEYNFSWAARQNIKRWSAELFYSQFNTTVGIFTGSHVGSLSDLNAAINADVPKTKNEFSYSINRPYQHVEHELAKAALTYTINKKNTIQLEIARQYNDRSEYDNHRGFNTISDNTPQLQFKITSYTTTLHYKHQWHKRIKGDVGINGMHQENTTSGRVFIPNFINQTLGAYWYEKIMLNKFQFELGIRYDQRQLTTYFNRNNVVSDTTFIYHQPAFTIGSVYNITESTNLGITFNHANRSPAVNELFSKGLHHGSAAIENGDKNLITENAYNTNLNLTHHSRKWSLQTNVFVNAIRNFIYLQPIQPPLLTLQGAFPQYQYMQTNALLIGGDINLRYLFSQHWSASLQASTITGYDVSHDGYLIYMPPTRISPEIAYTFKARKNIKETTIRLSTSTIFQKANAPTEQDYLPAPATYTLVHAEITSLLRVNQTWLTVGVKGNNLLNTVYRDYLDKFRYYHDAIGRNIQVFVKIPIQLIH